MKVYYENVNNETGAGNRAGCVVQKAPVRTQTTSRKSGGQQIGRPKYAWFRTLGGNMFLVTEKKTLQIIYFWLAGKKKLSQGSMSPQGVTG